jgi:hypothetical protein
LNDIHVSEAVERQLKMMERSQQSGTNKTTENVEKI